MENVKKKVCFAASSGGHFEQLMMLRPVMDRYDSFILTEKTSYLTEVEGLNYYYLKQVNRRELKFIPRMLSNFYNSYKIFKKEKPDVIISTGALATIPMLLLAKFYKKKIVFIESFAKVTSPTKTGRLIYKFADVFYVQWVSMLEFYPKAIFLGAIY